MAQEKWFLYQKAADFNAWSRELGVDPVIALLIRNRDITELAEAKKYLYGTLDDLHDPFLLKDMDVAVSVLQSAIAAGKKIRVIGDYDVDGVTSSFILTKGLKCLQADVDTAIPHRMHDGYGLNENLIREAAADGIELIVTCDNGISAGPQIQLAKELGIDVVVTDHHEVPFQELADGTQRQNLPPALAVVDPKRDDCAYPFKCICGAMVAYKLMSALLQKTGAQVLQAVMEELLIFAAIGTVCDIMELQDENRIVVKEGLRLIANTTNLGLRALIEVNQLALEKINAYSFGFVIGPCINATGRLDTAVRALELLMATDYAEAVALATELHELNESRKNLTQEGVEAAIAYVEEHHLQEQAIWIIYLPDVHESIAGIIAGKVKEIYHHPVFVLTRSEDGVKGSGRSIEGYHMFENMMRNKDFFTKFGGHAMAAGLSMEEGQIEPLREALNRDCKLQEKDFVRTLHLDAAMPLSYANMNLAKQLTLLEPTGTGNPQPIFAQKDLILEAILPMGKNPEHMKLQVRTQDGTVKELIAWGEKTRFLDFLEEKYGAEAVNAWKAHRGKLSFHAAYQVQINNWRGNESLQFIMKSYC